MEKLKLDIPKIKKTEKKNDKDFINLIMELMKKIDNIDKKMDNIDKKIGKGKKLMWYLSKNK